MRRFCFRAARRGRRVGLVLTVALLAGLTSLATGVPSARSATESATSGYWLVGTDGGIFSYGKAGFFGSTGAIKLNQPIAGMAATPDGRGYWMVASDGGIFAFGNAGFHGSMGGKPLNKPIVAMAATRTGKGYWLVASDGGIFAFGDAPFLGSTGAIKLNKPIVDIVPTPSGRGYWMAASDGGIFAFGDAGFHGSTGAIKLAKRIQQMAATPSGKGYWMVAGDGGVFAFGDAGFHGSAAEGATEKRVVDIAPSATGKGYYITASNGAVYAYGDAKHHGDIDGKLNHGIIAMVPVNTGEPPSATNDVVTVSEDGTAIVDVLANDRDPEGGVLVIQSVGIPLHGTTTVDNGRIVYRPTANYHGTDTFSYTIIDANGHTAVGLVSVTVQPVDDLPRAVNDVRTVALGQTITIDVLENDSGLGDGFMELAILIGPGQGQIAKSADGRSIVFTPKNKGQYTITYRVIDADGDNAQADVTITVTGPSPKAVKVGPIKCSAGSCTTDLAMASGISFGNNGKLTLDGEQGGTKVVDGVGTFHRQGTVISFTAARGNVRSVEVLYRIVTADNETSSAKVEFDYQNSAPTANGGSDPTPLPVNTQGQYQLSGNDPDGDAPQLTFWLVGVVEPGATATIDQNGMLHFSAPVPGVWTIQFVVRDPSGDESPVAEFKITTTV